MIDRNIHEMIRHMLWADDRVSRAVLESVQAQSDPKIRELLYHLHVVQNAFLQLWRNENVEVPTPESFGDVAQIASYGMRIAAEICDFVHSADDGLLETELGIPWSKRVEKMLGRPAAAVTVRQSMIQVATHSAYHRGQINARLRVSGIEPPMVDFIAWVWSGQPEPAVPPQP